MDLQVVLRSRHNGRCVSAGLLDFAKLLRGIAFDMISGSDVVFDNRRR